MFEAERFLLGFRHHSRVLLFVCGDSVPEVTASVMKRNRFGGSILECLRSCQPFGQKYPCDLIASFFEQTASCDVLVMVVQEYLLNPFCNCPIVGGLQQCRTQTTLAEFAVDCCTHFCRPCWLGLPEGVIQSGHTLPCALPPRQRIFRRKVQATAGETRLRLRARPAPGSGFYRTEREIERSGDIAQPGWAGRF